MACALLLAAVLILPALWLGCGYHRVEPGNNLPQDIRSVAVPVFRNDTFESGVEVLVTDALREQIVRSGFVKLKDVRHADALVVGSIRKFSVKALSFSEGDFAVEYRASVVLQIKLVSRSGQVLWEDAKLSRYDDYRSSTNIFESESARSQAIAQIVIDLMADVHDRIFDGFTVDSNNLVR